MTDDGFLLVQILSPILDGLAGLVVLLAPLTRRDGEAKVTFGHAVVAACAVSGVFLLKAAWLLGLQVEGFAIIRLACLDVFVMLPIVSVITVTAARRRRRSWRRGLTSPTLAISIGALFVPLLGGWATFVEPYLVKLERGEHRISEVRTGRAPLLVGVLADIQLAEVTERHFREIRRFMAYEPDLIVLPGDYYQGSPDRLEEELPALRSLLSELRAPGGIYFVMGNCEDPYEVERILDGSPIEVLINRTVQVRVKDRLVTIGGVELDCGRPEARAFAQSLESTEGDEDIRLLVSHWPDVVFNLSSDSRIDLVIAGHTHGGQVQLPFIGPILTLSDVPRKVAAGGLHEMDGRSIYVSRGFGWECGRAPRIRFLCPPEMTLIALE